MGLTLVIVARADGATWPGFVLPTVVAAPRVRVGREAFAHAGSLGHVRDEADHAIQGSVAGRHRVPND